MIIDLDFLGALIAVIAWREVGCYAAAAVLTSSTLVALWQWNRERKVDR